MRQGKIYDGKMKNRRLEHVSIMLLIAGVAVLGLLAGVCIGVWFSL